jgi:hypothetical protein
LLYLDSLKTVYEGMYPHENIPARCMIQCLVL